METRSGVPWELRNEFVGVRRCRLAGTCGCNGGGVKLPLYALKFLDVENSDNLPRARNPIIPNRIMGFLPDYFLD